MVCPGVQSCFEHLAFEPYGLEHKINQPKPNQWPEIPLILENQNERQEKINNKNKTPSNNSDQKNNTGDASAWNIIESLSNKNEKANQDENVYVHPLVKKPSSLSLKSLEMCTESLGSETGDEFSLSLSPKTNEEYRQMWRLKYEMSTKKVSGSTNFPPPLSSITGSDSVQVTPHREGGRLVLKAATGSPCSSYFQAERVDGRLRLCLVEDNYESDGEYELQAEEEEYDDDDENENSENFMCEMEIGDRLVPRRCKESGHENKGMPNWEPCWVAIS